MQSCGRAQIQLWGFKSAAKLISYSESKDCYLWLFLDHAGLRWVSDACLFLNDKLQVVFLTGLCIRIMTQLFTAVRQVHLLVKSESLSASAANSVEISNNDVNIRCKKYRNIFFLDWRVPTCGRQGFLRISNQTVFIKHFSYPLVTPCSSQNKSIFEAKSKYLHLNIK